MIDRRQGDLPRFVAALGFGAWFEDCSYEKGRDKDKDNDNDYDYDYDNDNDNDNEKDKGKGKGTVRRE